MGFPALLHLILGREKAKKNGTEEQQESAESEPEGPEPAESAKSESAEPEEPEKLILSKQKRDCCANVDVLSGEFTLRQKCKHRI